MYSMWGKDISVHSCSCNSARICVQWVSRLLERGGVVVMDNQTTETACICQDCGSLVTFADAVKVTSEGWLCNICCEIWRKGNDIY